MIEFIAGIALGAAFSPFWMKVWTFVSNQFKALTNKEGS